MARHKQIRTEEQEEPRMDISSMIDCCFLLLIYFLVATTLVSEKKLDIQVPGGESSGEPAPLEPGRISVKADGSVFWNDDMAVGDAYDPNATKGTTAFSGQRRMEQLVDQLALLKNQAETANTTPIVIMTGAADAPHQRIVDVMAALAEVRIQTVGLSTDTQ